MYLLQGEELNDVFHLALGLYSGSILDFAYLSVILVRGHDNVLETSPNDCLFLNLICSEFIFQAIMVCTDTNHGPKKIGRFGAQYLAPQENCKVSCGKTKIGITWMTSSATFYCTIYNWWITILPNIYKGFWSTLVDFKNSEPNRVTVLQDDSVMLVLFIMTI